jgi:hypothetical protein
LAVREESCIGESTGKLYFIKFQSCWTRNDIAKLEEHLK